VKPTTTTENTLILSLWVEGPNCAIVGALRREDDVVVPDVYMARKACTPWTTLVEALAEAAIIGMKHLLIVSNDKNLVAALTPPLRPPAPTEMERHWALGWGEEGQRGGYVEIPWGGDIDHWRVLGLLACGQWAGCWRAVWSDGITKARELCQQQQQNA
jgi:hypothetical protein